MTSNFSKRRNALLGERAKAISNIAPNPAHAVEKVSLTAMSASSRVAASTTPFVDTSMEVSLTPSNKNDKGKGKKVVYIGPKGKLAHEGARVEYPRKKPTQGPRLTTVIETDETMALIVHTPESSKAPGGPLKVFPITPGPEKASNCRS